MEKRLTIGPYRAVYEAHLQNYLSKGYPQTEAAALAQSVVAFPLPEAFFCCKAGYLEQVVPQAADILEFNQYEAISMKVTQAVQENADLFSDADDPKNMTLNVSGVYPGLVVVEAMETGCWYAADWELKNGTIEISRVRTISTYYNTMVQGVTEGLMPAIDLLQEARLIPLEVERDFISALVLGQKVIIPEAKIDGVRPVYELEFVQYLRAANVLTEAQAPATVMPGGELTSAMSKSDALVKLAVLSSELACFESEAFQARLALVRPLMGTAMTEKSTTIQSVIVAKNKFSQSEATALAKRNSWGSSDIDTSDSYRFRQHNPSDCENGSFHTIRLKEGVSAVICKLKGKAKTEQRLHEAGDLANVAGHTVHVDQDKAKDGDLSNVETQIKAHNRFSEKLQGAGFKDQGYGGDKKKNFKKSTGKGYDVHVSLTGGKAHTTIARGGMTVGVIGSASNGPQLEDHLDQAEDMAEKMPDITGYSSGETTSGEPAYGYGSE